LKITTVKHLLTDLILLYLASYNVYYMPTSKKNSIVTFRKAFLLCNTKKELINLMKTEIKLNYIQ